ncbi:hypothetical protein F5H01DRAFT_367674 [Linnemannia elongata]|nr:hypothetical protein F5H01DRAFT_367674 [Linnemannia elongata]
MRFSALVGLVASVFLIGSAVGNPAPAPSDEAVQAEKWHEGGGYGGPWRRSLEDENVIDGDERALWGWGGGGWRGGGWRGGGWRGGGWRGGGWRGGGVPDLSSAPLVIQSPIMTVKSALVFALSTFLTVVSAVPYYPSSGPVINPQTTIAPQTDFIPITNVQPVVNVLPTDYNDYSWWGPLNNAYLGGWGGAGSGAWSGGFGGGAWGTGGVRSWGGAGGWNW